MCQCLNMLVVLEDGGGTRFTTCLVCTMCVAGIVACVTSDKLCCPKSLYANQQHGCAI